MGRDIYIIGPRARRRRGQGGLAADEPEEQQVKPGQPEVGEEREPEEREQQEINL